MFSSKPLRLSVVIAALDLSCGFARAAAPDALVPLAIKDVTINDGFWSPKISLWSSVTINDTFDKLDQHGGFTNFDRVAQGLSGNHSGEPWWDGLIYETIRAAGDFLAANPDPVLQQRVDGYIARIKAAAAHDPDGYVNTAQQLENVGFKWKNPPTPGDTHDDDYPHTVYNAGCLVEAAIHYYHGTGDTELLKVATRMANYMCGIMGPPPKQNIIPGHAVSE
ncbi:MAG: glycoside hydrolase family 127 protein, partial [Verrucomicrobiaceae bacterium]